MNDPETTTLPVTVEVDQLNDLRRLATAESAPGAAVSVDAIAGRAIRRYLDDERKTLRKLGAEDEAAELDRVMLVHGGGEAA